MVRVNYRHKSRRPSLIKSPIVICFSIVTILMILNSFFPGLMDDEKEVLTKLYEEEKEVLSHAMYGTDDGEEQSDHNPKEFEHFYHSSINNIESKKQNLKGWKPVHIFFGDDKHLAYLGRESQVQQDKLVMRLLNNPKNGFFVDLAANDATNLSNTYQLEKQLDWNGICIEPNPIYWTSLSHRKCNIAAAVVGKNRMEEIKFRMYPDLKKRAPSGGIEGYIDPSIPRSKEKSVELYTVPFLEILEKFDAPQSIEYLSLDVEGSEFLVMEAFPFDKYMFKVMTIERPSQDLVDLLIKHDYIYLAANNEDGMETAWVQKSVQNDINHDAIQEVGWKIGDTKWITMKNGKLQVNDPKKKQKGKKQ